MANEYKVAGSNLAAIFVTRTSAKRADVGFKIGGTDVSNSWEKTAGGDQIDYDTNYYADGTDLRYLFRSSGYTPPTATPAPTLTPTPAPTSTPLPTATPFPTGQPTPTPTPTPTPAPACHYWDLYYDSGGTIYMIWTKCIGGSDSAIDYYGGNDAYWGQSSCALDSDPPNGGSAPAYQDSSC